MKSDHFCNDGIQRVYQYSPEGFHENGLQEYRPAPPSLCPLLPEVKGKKNNK